MKYGRLLIAWMLLLYVGKAQKPDTQLSFEAASVKPSLFDPFQVPSRIAGGPDTGDPTHFTARNVAINNLILQAYNLKRPQVTFPAWSVNARFNIEAKLAPGTTYRQFLVMLQDLLATRFHLKIHEEKKEMPVFDLIVTKRGIKFKEVKGQPTLHSEQPSNPGRVSIDKDGYPEFLPGSPPIMIANGLNGHSGLQMLGGSMEQLIEMVSARVDRLIRDQTGLRGRYDLTLRWATTGTSASDTGPSIFDALQEQLGLKLEPVKGVVLITVIDHVDKTPTEN